MSTPRGSGTNGFVQKNLSFVKPKHKELYSDQVLKKGKRKKKKEKLKKLKKEQELELELELEEKEQEQEQEQEQEDLWISQLVF